MSHAMAGPDAASGVVAVATRHSEREWNLTACIAAPVSEVFGAWTDAVLFRKWWVPRSLGLELLDCALDVRTGGTYCLTFRHPESGEPLPFHGTYLEVSPPGAPPTCSTEKNLLRCP